MTRFETVAKKFEKSRILQTNERTTENTKNLREPTNHHEKTRAGAINKITDRRPLCALQVSVTKFGQDSVPVWKFCLVLSVFV